MTKVCKKCGYERQLLDAAPEYEYPKYKAIYTKVEEYLKRKKLEEETRLNQENKRELVCGMLVEKLVFSVSSQWKNSTLTELLYLLISWIFSVFFIFMGLALIIKSPLAALSLMIISLLFLPPIRNFVYSNPMQVV